MGDAIPRGSYEAQRLDRWAAEARVVEAAQRRARSGSLRTQSGSASTLGGICIDLAERGSRLRVRLDSGTAHTGTISHLGKDYLALATPAGPVLVATAAITTLRPEPGTGSTRGGRSGDGTTLDEVLADLAMEQSPVALTTRGPDSECCTGNLVAASSELLILDSGIAGSGVGSSVFVTRSALAEVWPSERVR